jgi:hypothetical protein
MSRAGGAGSWSSLRGNETFVPAAQRGVVYTCWINVDAQTASTEQALMAKYYTVGNQRAALLELRDTGANVYPRVYFSTDGLAIIGALATTYPLAYNEWTFLAGRFVPSSSIDLYFGCPTYGFVHIQNATGIPATIFDSTEAFRLGGAQGGTGLFFDGQMSLAAIYNTDLTTSNIEGLYAQSRGVFY